MFDYFKLAGPLVRLFDPEAAHGLTITALKMGLVPPQPRVAAPSPGLPSPSRAGSRDERAMLSREACSETWSIAHEGTMPPCDRGVHSSTPST